MEFHEQLKEWLSEKAFCGVAKELGIKCDDHLLCFKCESKVIERIADRIETDYFPRLKFKDGKIAQLGCKFRWEDGSTQQLASVGFNSDATILFLKNGDCMIYKGYLDYPLKVVDVNGEKIEVGDFVYDLTGLYKTPLKVLEIIDDYYIKVSIPDGKGYTGFGSNQLSHKKPDSIEDIYNDLSLYAASEGAPIEDSLNPFLERLAAFKEGDK